MSDGIKNATLVAGTTFRIENSDTSLSEPKTLTEDMPVEILFMQVDEFGFNVYRTASGEFYYVKPGDEKSNAVKVEE